jgi:SagB-type dehydrogenase family enzyme
MRRVAYRRAPSLACYWRGSRFIIRNYVAQSEVVADARIVAVLSVATKWMSARRVAAALPGISLPVIQQALTRLVGLSLIESSERRNRTRDAAVREWSSWSPEAALFHFGVRDVEFADLDTIERALAIKAKRNPPPPALKPAHVARSIALPKPQRDFPVAVQLLERRTWRRFGRGAVDAAQLATLLGLTWGVQGWVGSAATKNVVALKTAPSGGARHSIEAYVLVRSVAELEPGLYRYDPDRHRLETISKGVQQIERYVPRQPWFGNASALIFMTSVFARTRWRYGYPRAYRSILFEAGHHCQTFLLLATSLGLAPFCTGALADSVIERDLGVDGISEAVLYACGVGTRPSGMTWAPSPPGVPLFRRRRPTWARSRHGGSSPRRDR